MRFERANAVQWVVAGLALIGMGALLLAFGLNDGHVGVGACNANSCTIISHPLSADKVVAGSVLMALGSVSAGAGLAYVLGVARPQPTSRPEIQD